MALIDGPGMKSLQEMLNNIFAEAIAAAYPDLPEAPVVIMPSSNYKFGDYQCNSAMSMVQVSGKLYQSTFID
jgi:arginyl-tRNA synthetase